MMKKYQIVAIVVGVILTVVSFLPVIVIMKAEYNLAHPDLIKVFLNPTIGVVVAAVIVFIAFLKG